MCVAEITEKRRKIARI